MKFKDYINEMALRPNYKGNQKWADYKNINIDKAVSAIEKELDKALKMASRSDYDYSHDYVFNHADFRTTEAEKIFVANYNDTIEFNNILPKVEKKLKAKYKKAGWFDLKLTWYKERGDSQEGLNIILTK